MKKLLLFLPIVIVFLVMVYSPKLISKANEDVANSTEMISKEIISPVSKEITEESQKILDLKLATMSSIASECRDNIDGRTFLVCGTSCPFGSSFVAAQPNHPSCGGAAGTMCPSIVDLGWRGGHKNNFCINKGFQGVLSAAECGRGDYRDGGWCFRTGERQACYRALNCG